MIEAVELSPSFPREESASSFSGTFSSASITVSCGGGEAVLGLLLGSRGLPVTLGLLPGDFEGFLAMRTTSGGSETCREMQLCEGWGFERLKGNRRGE